MQFKRKKEKLKKKFLLIEYLNYRKSIRLPNNQSVIDDLISFLKPYSKEEQEKIIKEAIKKGWKEFYPPRKEEKKEVKYETI